MDASRPWAKTRVVSGRSRLRPCIRPCGRTALVFPQSPAGPEPSADERLIPAIVPMGGLSPSPCADSGLARPGPTASHHDACCLPAFKGLPYPFFSVGCLVPGGARRPCHPGVLAPPPIVLHGRPPTTSKNPGRAAKKPAAALYPSGLAGQPLPI